MHGSRNSSRRRHLQETADQMEQSLQWSPPSYTPIVPLKRDQGRILSQEAPQSKLTRLLDCQIMQLALILGQGGQLSDENALHATDLATPTSPNLGSPEMHIPYEFDKDDERPSHVRCHFLSSAIFLTGN